MKKVIFDCNCSRASDQHLTYGNEYELMAESGDNYIILNDDNIITKVSKSRFKPDIQK